MLQYLSGRFYPLSSPETLEACRKPRCVGAKQGFTMVHGRFFFPEGDTLGVRFFTAFCNHLQPLPLHICDGSLIFFWGRSSPESTIFFGGVNNPWRWFSHWFRGPTSSARSQVAIIVWIVPSWWQRDPETRKGQGGWYSSWLAQGMWCQSLAELVYKLLN